MYVSLYVVRLSIVITYIYILLNSQVIYRNRCRSTFRKHTKMVNYVQYAVVAHSFRRDANGKNQGTCNANFDNCTGLVYDHHYLVNANVMAPYMPPMGKEVAKFPDGSVIRSEQKALTLMRELVARYSQEGETVMDLFGGTFSTALACFHEGRKVVSFEKDVVCASASIRHLSNKVLEGVEPSVFSSNLHAPGKEEEVVTECTEEYFKGIVSRKDGMLDTLEHAKVSFMHYFDLLCRHAIDTVPVSLSYFSRRLTLLV